MVLRGIEFGSVFCAPGARNFYGEGYPFHRIWRHLGMDWHKTTFVTKGITLNQRKGNMPLKDDGITPKEFLPRCIIVKFWSGHILNDVSLSGPGADFLFRQEIWQKRKMPFLLQFMAVGQTREERLAETKLFVALAYNYLGDFRTSVGLQFNFGCPNVGIRFNELQDEIFEMFDLGKELEIPLIGNFNPLAKIELLLEIAKHPACDALWLGNTIPWGTVGINWRKLFGTNVSPLRLRGFSEGGLSGPACLPFTIRKVSEMRAAGITLPIVAGGGIQSVKDVHKVKQAGANAIAIGAVAIVRPWRMTKIIEAGHLCFK